MAYKEYYEISSRSVKGSRITLNVISNDKGTCKEIVINSDRFNFRCWLLWTVFIYSVGYYYQLHFQDIKVMYSLVCFLFVVLLIRINFKVKQESLLIMASMGVQLTTKFASGRTSSMFYNMRQVHDIVINEGVTMQQVIYYICLLLHNCSDAHVTTNIIPLFTRTWPSLDCLRIIRREVRPLLPCGPLSSSLASGNQRL